MIKHSIEYIIKEFNKEGYLVLDTEYGGAHNSIKCLCSNGHEIYLSYNKFKKGSRCKYCNGSEIYFDDIVKAFSKEGYKVLTTKDKYINSKSKIKCLCPNNHICYISWSHWKSGTRCKECYLNSIRISKYKIKNSLQKDNYVLLSDLPEFCGAKYGFKVRCFMGHEYFTNWSVWKKGHRCKLCSIKKRFDKLRLDYKFVKKSIESCGYKVLSDYYTNAFIKLSIMCDKGHQYKVRWNDWQQGNRCPICAYMTSNGQKELYDYLKSLGFNVIENDRTLIYPKELDIVIPDKKIAIEYCGLYWHSEKMGKDKNYHLNKLKACQDIGYKLITIFEDEWLYRNDIVRNILMSTLDITKED